MIGAGNSPAFNTPAISCASCLFAKPVIRVPPEEILAWIEGNVKNSVTQNRVKVT